MQPWTATITRRTFWMSLDVGVLIISILSGLLISAYLSGVDFDVKFSSIKFVGLLSCSICCLIATGAFYLKTFRSWEAYQRDVKAILVGCIMCFIAMFFLFFVARYNTKEIHIVFFDAMMPSALAFILLSLVRGFEYFRQKLKNHSVDIVFVEVRERWFDAIKQADRNAPDNWHFHFVSTDNALEAEFPSSIMTRDTFRQWLDGASEHSAQKLLVLGQEIPKTEDYNHMIRRAYGNKIPITNMIDFHEEVLEKTPLFETGDTWFSASGKPNPQTHHLILKRIIDILIAIPLAFISLPVIGILSIYIKRESDGPAIFTQERVGLNGKIFTLYKLRTMTVHDDDSHQWPNFEASKVTAFGERLRKTGLDELPQILNVIKGDMSFVGPRPARPVVTRRHEERLPFYSVSYSVKPGISGWAQLHQGQDSGDETMFEKVRHNLYYAKYFSTWLDIVIYIRTFSQLIMGKKQRSRRTGANLK